MVRLRGIVILLLAVAFFSWLGTGCGEDPKSPAQGEKQVTLKISGMT